MQQSMGTLQRYVGILEFAGLVFIDGQRPIVKVGSRPDRKEDGPMRIKMSAS